jgi:hypothetical protein
MLPRNKRGEKQQSTGRLNARATGRQRRVEEGVGREGISRKLKNTHCVRSMSMMSPLFTSRTLSFHCSHNKTRPLGTARWKQRRRRKGCYRTHTHTRTHTHACCVFIGGRGRGGLSALWKLHPAATLSSRGHEIYTSTVHSHKSNK